MHPNTHCTCNDCRGDLAHAQHDAAIDQRRQAIAADPVDVAEIIEAGDPWWLIEAAVHAVQTKDWAYLERQYANHAPALIDAAAAERVAA